MTSQRTEMKVRSVRPEGRSLLGAFPPSRLSLSLPFRGKQLTEHSLISLRRSDQHCRFRSFSLSIYQPGKKAQIISRGHSLAQSFPRSSLVVSSLCHVRPIHNYGSLFAVHSLSLSHTHKMEVATATTSLQAEFALRTQVTCITWL